VAGDARARLLIPAGNIVGNGLLDPAAAAAVKDLCSQIGADRVKKLAGLFERSLLHSSPFAQAARPICTARTRDVEFWRLTRSEGGADQIASLTEGMDGTQKVELALRAAWAARFFMRPPHGESRNNGCGPAATIPAGALAWLRA